MRKTFEQAAREAYAAQLSLFGDQPTKAEITRKSKTQGRLPFDESKVIREPKGTSTGGRFAKKRSRAVTETIVDGGRVKMVQAKAGGEVSDVDGKFYKGGQWMPVHGLASGQDKPKTGRPKAKGPPPTAKTEGAGKRPTARKMTAEQIAEEKERRETQATWDRLRGQDVGEMFWMGDRAFKAGRNLKKFTAHARTLSNEQLKELADEGKAIVREQTMETEKRRGEDHEGLDEHLDWLEQNMSLQEFNATHRKLDREKGDFGRAWYWSADSIPDRSGPHAVKVLERLQAAIDRGKDKPKQPKVSGAVHGWTFKNLTKAQGELFNDAVTNPQAGDIHVGPRQIQTARKLADLGLGRYYIPRGQTSGGAFEVAKDWRDKISEVHEHKSLPFGTYATVSIQK